VSSKKSVPPLHIEPRVSVQLSVALLFIHGLALIAVFSLSEPVWVYFTLVSLVLMNFYMTFNTHVLGRGKRAILSMIWDENGDWVVTSNDGQPVQAKLLPGSFVHVYLMILSFRLENHQRRNVLILPDALHPNTYRKLLARMRIDGARSK
jgi:hypothetical protein